MEEIFDVFVPYSQKLYQYQYISWKKSKKRIEIRKWEEQIKNSLYSIRETGE